MSVKNFYFVLTLSQFIQKRGSYRPEKAENKKIAIKERQMKECIKYEVIFAGKKKRKWRKERVRQLEM